MGSVNPDLKRCPSRWQCPVNSPNIYLNWSLFNFNWSFVLLADGLDISLSPVMDSHCLMWFLLVQSLIALLATPTEMPWAALGLMNGCSDPVLASRSAVSLQAIPSWPCTRISWTLLCLTSCMRDWWQSQTSFVVIWCSRSVLIAAWLIEYRYSYYYSFYLESRLHMPV
jgi:hypothetical protein